MNMRQLKHHALSKVFFGAAFAAMLSEFHNKAYALMDAPPVRDPKLAALADEVLSKHQQFQLNIETPLQRELREEMVEMAKREFVCQRVKDGVVVDAFDTREAALTLVRKHIKQKKAKLQVMDSLTAQLVPFSEEELAV